MKPVVRSVVEILVGLTCMNPLPGLGYGYGPRIIDAPASSSSLSVRGEFQVIWYSPSGQKLYAVPDSGAVNSPRPRMNSPCVSANTLILFPADTCQVNRSA